MVPCSKGHELEKVVRIPHELLRNCQGVKIRVIVCEPHFIEEFLK